jgi:hypothetical protein
MGFGKNLGTSTITVGFTDLNIRKITEKVHNYTLLKICKLSGVNLS